MKIYFSFLNNYKFDVDTILLNWDHIFLGVNNYQVIIRKDLY